jgi:hypothetical protein
MIQPKQDKEEKAWEFHEDDNSFWVHMKSLEDDKVVSNGKIRIRVDIMPVELAEKAAVGTARDEPNHSPHLPPPEGRLTLTLNPFAMFN